MAVKFDNHFCTKINVIVYRVVSLMIEDTVKSFLFQSSSTSTTTNGSHDESASGEDKVQYFFKMYKDQS